MKCSSRTDEELNNMSERVYKQHTDDIAYALSVLGKKSSINFSPNLPSNVSHRQSSSTKNTASRETDLVRENAYFGNTDIEVRLVTSLK
jgi:hypothetical protein